VPGGVISEHIHPVQEERFTIVAGEARFIIAGKETTAKAREAIVVPAGVRHCEGDPTSVEIAAVVEFRPAPSRDCSGACLSQLERLQQRRSLSK